MDSRQYWNNGNRHVWKNCSIIDKQTMLHTDDPRGIHWSNRYSSYSDPIERHIENICDPISSTRCLHWCSYCKNIWWWCTIKVVTCTVNNIISRNSTIINFYYSRDTSVGKQNNCKKTTNIYRTYHRRTQIKVYYYLYFNINLFIFYFHIYIFILLIII